MITYEITEVTILTILSKCTLKITMHELFDLFPPTGLPQESAVTFIKTLNQLLELDFVETSQNSDGLIYWSITEDGRQQLNNLLHL